MASHTATMGNLPSGIGICTTIPDILYLPELDFAYHGIAAFFYLSASVALAKVTLDMKDGSSFQNYQLDISAVVFSYVATLLYFIHTILSAIRWKSF
ncbi:myelin and lymphocyte protein-like isoform X2 [Acanthopagrus latus]|uniref:myelin and lymphocyte protein-like isoform X2 n=1 Tax=Acanthopagrus latus TaxID=8177 RepID=UPI00187CFE93|nr:myelin and lymphocyte protein-like isoform X2 [Acanthopagrus latus]